MNFKVTLKKSDGTEETKDIEAPSRFVIYGEAEKEGSTVLSIEEGSGTSLWKKIQSVKFGSGIKTVESIQFTKNLSAMLTAGLTLSRALSVIERQSKNKNLKTILLDLEEQIKAGSTFHEALDKYPKIFSRLFISMTKAGEESGTLSDALKVVGRQMDRSFSLQKKIKGAMIYPMIILFAIVVIGILMMIYVVPTLSSTFKSLNVDLPVATKVIIATSDFMSSHAILVFLIFGALSASLYFFVKSTFGSKVVLRGSLFVPVIGELVRETMSARAARSMSSLLMSGVEMLTALSIAEEVVGDNIFGKVVGEAATRVKKGEALSAAFADYPKLYPLFMADMIAVGEETGKVSDMLSQVAEYYETDVEEKTKDLSTIIEPLLMLFIGGAVGIFAVAMITPIYSLSSKI